MSVLKTCKLICVSAVLLLTQFNLKAQSLGQGSITVIGWSALTDIVRFAVLTNIPSGTVIKITDKGWNQATNAFSTSATGDGVVTWTTSSLIPKGTVLSLFLGGTGDAQPTTLTNVTTGGSLTADISFTGFTVTDPMGIAGDQIFVYQGLDTNPFFIFGFNNSSGTVDGTGWNTSLLIALRDSQIPNGTGSQNSLVNGTNAVGMPGGGAQQDNVQYTGSTAGAIGTVWLGRFSNVANWSGDNTGTLTSSITNSIVVSIALPVSLLNFSAEVKDDNVLLQWRVAEENNFSHYEIESSLNGMTFTPVTKIVSTGGPENKQYNWTHAIAPNLHSAKLYYRLKLVDNDDKYNYSRIIMVTPGNSVKRILSVSPNPFAGQFSIYLNLPSVGALNFRLTDINGAVVLQNKITGEKGFSSITVPAPDGLAKGTYLLTVVYQKEIYRYKLIKK